MSWQGMTRLPQLLQQIRQCRECEKHLELGPRPIVQAGRGARILIVGQAPGRHVHESGVPWADASGDRLRNWIGIERERFYDANLVALVPMGFCYPGTGNSGDLPPRQECAELWHNSLLAQLENIRLTLLIGKYAQTYYLPETRGVSLTDRVRDWRTHAPAVFTLPHPSPRNNRWLKSNRWFTTDLLLELKQRTMAVVANEKS